MKKCSYCGRENEDTAAACMECGTEMVQPAHAPALPPPLPGRPVLSKPEDDHVRLFQRLVLVSLITLGLGYWEMSWGHHFLSSESRTLLEWDGYHQALAVPHKVVYLEFILFAVSLLGLYWFLRSARILYLCLAAAFLLQMLLGGMRVSTPLGAFIAHVGMLADGAVLVMAFTSPLKERFT
jgi:hypothetical protein